jgi:hypothetical protein
MLLSDCTVSALQNIMQFMEYRMHRSTFFSRNTAT